MNQEAPKQFNCYLNVEMLTRLGQISGHQFDLERLQGLSGMIDEEAEGDPMAQLASVTEELGLKLTPVQLRLSEAVWQAHADNPVVVWSEPEQQFLIISQASTFRVRLVSYSDSARDATTISRSKLASRLGLKSLTPQLK